MVSFYSDNTTGSAWVSSMKGFSLPRRFEPLESPFLAGDHAKAMKRRKRRQKNRDKQLREREPRTYTQVPQQKPRPAAQSRPGAQPRPATQARPASASKPAPSGQRAPANTRRVGRLIGVTTPKETSPWDRIKRRGKNFFNNRLSVVSDTTFPDSAGYALDGVELTKAEYEAWLNGNPEANRLLFVDTQARPD